MGEEEEDSEGYLRYKKRRALHRGPDHHMEPNSSQEGSSWEIEVKPPSGELSVSLFPHLPSLITHFLLGRKCFDSSSYRSFFRSSRAISLCCS